MDRGPAADAQEHIVATAARVFASEATRHVTLKRVALEATVPPDTVTERFDTAADLLRSAYGALAAKIESGFAEGHVPRHGGELDEHQSAMFDDVVMITTRALLDGVTMSEMAAEFPMVESMTRQAIDAGTDERTARFRTFELLVLEFGYRFFARPLAEVCGLARETDECLRTELNQLQVTLRDLRPVAPCGRA